MAGEGAQFDSNTLDSPGINSNSNAMAMAMAGGLSEGLEIQNNKTLDEINNNVGEGSEVSHSDDQWAHNLSAQLSSVGLSEKDFFTGIFSYGYDDFSISLQNYRKTS